MADVNLGIVWFVDTPPVAAGIGLRGDAPVWDEVEALEAAGAEVEAALRARRYVDGALAAAVPGTAPVVRLLVREDPLRPDSPYALRSFAADAPATLGALLWRVYALVGDAPAYAGLALHALAYDAVYGAYEVVCASLKYF